LASLEAYYHRLHQFLHFGIELKHDLHSLFTDGKLLTELITDGFYIFAHVKTNCSDIMRTGLNEYADKAHLK